MAKFLDVDTSQNASYANSIAVPFTVIDTPELVGQIGLNVVAAGTGLRVLFEGTISFQLPVTPVATTVTVTIVRGTLSTDLLVYSASRDLDLSILGPQVLSFSGSDFDVPMPGTGYLDYTMFVSTSAIGVIRVGPESFNGHAYSD